MCVKLEVIKKAYQQESEFECGEVSPMEVGHNIYILALQVLSDWSDTRLSALLLLFVMCMFVR